MTKLLSMFADWLSGWVNEGIKEGRVRFSTPPMSPKPKINAKGQGGIQPTKPWPREHEWRRQKMVREARNNPMPMCKPHRSETVNRLEVIGPDGRMYILDSKEEYKHEISYQDGGKTLKIFLKESTNE